MMRDVAARELSTEILGTLMSAPVVLSPVDVQSIIHRNGESAASQAAASQPRARDAG
jgi:L-lactate dehydrogenase (cytochrome)